MHSEFALCVCDRFSMLSLRWAAFRLTWRTAIFIRYVRNSSPIVVATLLLLVRTSLSSSSKTLWLTRAAPLADTHRDPANTHREGFASKPLFTNMTAPTSGMMSQLWINLRTDLKKRGPDLLLSVKRSEPFPEVARNFEMTQPNGCSSSF